MLPKTAEYALRAAVSLGRTPGKPATAQQLATVTRIPRRYLHKVLQGLVHAELARSQSGPGGGYMLAGAADQVTILDVVNAVAPLVRIKACPLGLASHTSLCPLHQQLDQLVAMAERTLSRVTIADVLCSASPIVPLCEVTQVSLPRQLPSRREANMNTITSEVTVGELVAQRAGLSRLFESRGVDYCCGGKKTLAEVCQEKGWNPEELIEAIEQSASEAEDDQYVDASAMSLAELCDHIEQTHHAYLRREFPRLAALTEKVAAAHGSQDSRLESVHKLVGQLIDELSLHMMKEEKVLFPIIRLLDSGSIPPSFHCGSVANPIRQMESEHQDAGCALGQLRDLTDGYSPPDWACNTYRALLDALLQLELDMHQHVHKEDNILFPATKQRELALAGTSAEEW